MPKAASICSGVKPISLPVAAVAPNTPIAAVRCQPRSSVLASAMRHDTSSPSATADRTSRPVTPSRLSQLWDGNIQDHADQGVAITVAADVAGKQTTLLRFNCFDFEKSYIYGPENTELEVAGPETLGGAALTNLYRMDPIADGNPIGWTIKTLGTKLPKMLERAGYPQIAARTDLAEVASVLPDLEVCARA